MNTMNTFRGSVRRLALLSAARRAVIALDGPAGAVATQATPRLVVRPLAWATPPRRGGQIDALRAPPPSGAKLLNARWAPPADAIPHSA